MNNKFIYLGTIKKEFWYLIFLALISLAINIVNEIRGKKSEKDDYGSHTMLYLTIMFLTEALAFPIYFYYSKTQRKPERVTNELMQAPNKANPFIIFLVVLISICDLLHNILDWVPLNQSKVILDIFSGLFILILAGLCILILKYKYHRHHLIGIGIMYTGLFLDSIVYHADDKKKSGLLFNIVISVFINVSKAFHDVYEKYLMDKIFFAPLLILGLQGVIKFIIMLILLIFVGPLNCEFSSLLDFETGLCTENKPIDDAIQGIMFIFSHIDYLLLTICQIVLQYSYNIFRVYINYYYSPAHRLFSKTIRAFLRWLLYFIPYFGNNASNEFITLLAECIGFILQIVGLMIFIEVVILGMFSLNKNVTEEIEKRQLKDYEDKEKIMNTEISMIPRERENEDNKANLLVKQPTLF